MNPNSFTNRMLRAKVRLEAMDWKGAEVDCRAALESTPAHSATRVMLAICLDRQREFSSAQNELQRALSMVYDQDQKQGLMEFFKSKTR